nr:cytochrome P450 [Tanacetum cinerariifolium]
MTPSINVFRESVRLEWSTRVAIDRFIYWVAYDRIAVYDGVFQFYGIWMMGEGGVMTSFKKLFTINIPDLSTMTLLRFRKNGEPIMESTEYEELAALEVYEPCSEHINNFGINGETGSFFICPYIETLLLIDHSDGCIIFNDGYDRDIKIIWHGFIFNNGSIYGHIISSHPLLPFNYLNTYKLSVKTLLQLPPGPPGLPIIGNLHKLDMFDLSDYLWRLSKRYGPLMSIRLGMVQTLVVSSAEIAKEVMKTNDLNFWTRPVVTGLQKISYANKDLAFLPYKYSIEGNKHMCCDYGVGDGVAYKEPGVSKETSTRSERPEEFKPERFMGSGSGIDYKGTDFELIPFRSGRIICPGISMAAVTMEMTLSNLIYSFDWESPVKAQEIDTLK